MRCFATSTPKLRILLQECSLISRMEPVLYESVTDPVPFQCPQTLHPRSLSRQFPSQNNCDNPPTQHERHEVQSPSGIVMVDAFRTGSGGSATWGPPWR